MKGKQYKWNEDKDRKITELYTSNALIEDIIYEMGTHRKVILARINYLKLRRPRLKGVRGIICPRDEKINTYVINHPSCDVADIEKATGINKAQIRATINRLSIHGVKDKGLDQVSLAYQQPSRETVGIMQRIGC